jgi:hypothetical protein
MEKQYDVTFTEQEISKVFDALIDRPFKEVAPLVAKLQEIYRANYANPAQHKQEEIKE